MDNIYRFDKFVNDNNLTIDDLREISKHSSYLAHHMGLEYMSLTTRKKFPHLDDHSIELIMDRPFLDNLFEVLPSGWDVIAEIGNNVFRIKTQNKVHDFFLNTSGGLYWDMRYEWKHWTGIDAWEESERIIDIIKEIERFEGFNNKKND